MKKTYFVLASILSTTVFNGSTSASAQSLFGGVPSIVRSCHDFSSRDWTAPDTASFLRSIVCEDHNQDPKAETTSCDEPSTEQCNSESTSSSSSPKEDGYPVPKAMKLIKTIVYDEPTFVDVYEDLLITSDAVIESTNLHFTVHEGATLTFQAPAIKIARDQDSAWPLFELSGKVVFKATGSTQVLLDGSVKDTDGIVQVMGDGAVFMSDPYNVVRYHRSGMTVSKMEDAGDLDDLRRQKLKLSPELNASLAAIHAKVLAESDVPSSTFSSSYSSTSPPSSSLSTPEVSDNDGESDVCLLTPYYDTLDRPESCPNPAFCCSNTATTTSLGVDEAADHATANSDCNDNTGDCADSNGGTITCTTAREEVDNESKTTEQEHEYGHGDDAGGSHNSEAKPDQKASTTLPDPHTRTTIDVDPSVSSPKRVLKVGETLSGPLVSSTGKSAIWADVHGSIAFGEINAESSNESDLQNLVRGRPSILVASQSGPLKRVIQARAALKKEELEGEVVAHESRTWCWGWGPCRSRLHDDVETARGRVGELEMTLTNRAGVEVTMDGTRVLSRSGRFSREWMNRFPWRRRKNNSYELRVEDDGMEVRLGEKVVWGVVAEDKKR